MTRLALLVAFFVLMTETAGAIPAGRFREQAERVKEGTERRAGKPASNEQDENYGPGDRVRAPIDKARLQFTRTMKAADANMRRAFHRQSDASTAKGELDEVERVRRAEAAFYATAHFDAHDLPILAGAHEQWTQARERAARTVLAAFDRGIKSYTRAKRLAEATALRSERNSFAASMGLGAASSLPDGAVLHLSFEPDAIARKAEQSLAADQSGCGNAGLLRGAAIVKDGARGSAARFDGAGASIDCGKRAKLQSLTAFTVAAFVRIDGPSATGPLLSKDDWKPARGFVLRLRDAKPDFTIAAGGWHTVTSDQPLTPGQWHHLAGTYDGEQLRLYVDGMQVASKAMKGKLVASPFALVLGEGTFAKNRRFAGSLDEVMMFERALGESEIQEMAAVK